MKEVELQDEDGIVRTMKSKGLGDSIEKLTDATGIKRLVKSVVKNCGCNRRKEKLNKMFPYGRKKEKEV